MSTCPQCRCSVRADATSCPQCGALLPADEATDAADPDPDSPGFETGARRRWGERSVARSGAARGVDVRLRLVPSVQGSLALTAKKAREAEHSRALELPATEPAPVVPLRPPVPSPVPPPRRAERPPVLASEALRRELLPPTPASDSGRMWLACLGLLGASAAGLVGSAEGLGIPLGGACLALCTLALLPMTYQARAAATVALAGSALFVVHWAQLRRPDPVLPGLLPLGVTWLATALLFRSWHRASLLARGLVAVGIALCATFLWRAGLLGRLLTIEGAWQVWLLPLLAPALPLLLLLSLLAFMDARSTGGARAWACLLLVWFALFSGSALLPLAFPPGAASFDLGRVPATTALTHLTGPLLVGAVALGMAQLLCFARAGQRPT